MILTSFSGVTNVLLMHQGGGISGKCAGALGLSSGFLELNILVTCKEAIKPSVVAITVPLMEQKYIPEEMCALFIHLHMPQVVWAPLVSVV